VEVPADLTMPEQAEVMHPRDDGSALLDEAGRDGVECGVSR
jgi:hypothetical protein